MKKSFRTENLGYSLIAGILAFLFYGWLTSYRLVSIGIYFGKSSGDFIGESLIIYALIGFLFSIAVWFADGIINLITRKDSGFENGWQAFSFYIIAFVFVFFAFDLLLKIRLDWLLSIKRAPFVKELTVGSIGVLWLLILILLRTFKRFFLANTLISLLFKVVVPLAVMVYIVFITPYTSLKYATETKDDKPRVLFITIDTLRKDYVGCYGMKDILTPTLDSIAADGIIFDRVYSQAPYTWPSLASFMTGKYTVRHGVRMNFWKMKEGIKTLPAILKEKGIETVGISDIGLSDLDMEKDFTEVLEKKRNLCELQPFRRMLPFFSAFSAWFRPGSYSSLPTTLVVDKWLRGNGRKPGWLLWIHYYNDAPHSPYYSPEPYCSMYMPKNYHGEINGSVEQIISFSEKHAKLSEEDINALKALYKGEVTWVDRQIGVLIDRLKDLGIYDKTTIIINSDHGQMFGRNGNYVHGFYLYDELMRVPLIIKSPVSPPYLKGARIETLVRLVDLFPTIGDLFGLGPDSLPKGDGRSLMTFLKRGDDPNFNVWSYGETLKYANHDPSIKREAMEFGFYAVNSDGWKVIDVPEKGQEYLYNTLKDKTETRNFINDDPEIVSSLVDSVTSCFNTKEVKDLAPKTEHELSGEAAERLRALGYIQ